MNNGFKHFFIVFSLDESIDKKIKFGFEFQIFLLQFSLSDLNEQINNTHFDRRQIIRFFLQI